jgi:hypothetical protein
MRHENDNEQEVDEDDGENEEKEEEEDKQKTDDGPISLLLPMPPHHALAHLSHYYQDYFSHSYNVAHKMDRALHRMYFVKIQQILASPLFAYRGEFYAFPVEVSMNGAQQNCKFFLGIRF